MKLGNDVDRRRLIMTAAASWIAADGAGAQPAAAKPSTYSESVMGMVFAPDGSQALSARLARLVGQGSATIWAGYESTDAAFGVADVGVLAKGAGPTAVTKDAAVFDQAGTWDSRFERSGRSGAGMTGVARVRGGLHASADPPEGEGPLAGRIEIRFRALHVPVLVREGRMEVFGRGEGRIVLPDREVKFSGYAKWHEQVGDRPRFAPAFTYVALSGGDVALLAVTRGASANGFALENGKTTLVTALEISDLAAQRRFKATLADGRTVQGTARTLRTSSEPIEGQRRPSATVAAETTLGPMVGQINDWRPAA